MAEHRYYLKSPQAGLSYEHGGETYYLKAGLNPCPLGRAQHALAKLQMRGVSIVDEIVRTPQTPSVEEVVPTPVTTTPIPEPVKPEPKKAPKKTTRKK